MAFGQLSLKGRALRLLSGREHSRQELERKLASHEAEPGEMQRALDELQAKGFIDEQRVVDSVVHRRSGRLGADIRRHRRRHQDREILAGGDAPSHCGGALRAQRLHGQGRVAARGRAA